jgi:hydrogenase nickel incorporation protein HypA/HybF
MHELALAEDALKLVKERREQLGLKKITAIKFGIGAARISHQAEFKELFEMITKGSIFEGAKLEVEILPVKSLCMDCQTDVDPQLFCLDCANCGSTNIRLMSGNQLVVQAIA